MPKNYNTKQKSFILECIKETDGRHFTADDIADMLDKKGRHVGKATVYRHLDRLLSEGEIKRRDTAYATYKKAIAKGDENVYFIDGSTLCSEAGDSALVDGCHPTSLGFFLMARGIGKVLKEALNLK
jgi:Fe2+ or Zn2+ uptake regulation protein